MAKVHKQCTDEELLEMLVARAVVRGEALDQHKPGKANTQFKAMVKLSCELLRRGPSVHAKFLSLLAHENAYVRSWTAFVVLEIDSEKALPVLEEIGRSYPRNLNLGFSSKFTLEQWRNGDLRTISSWGCNKVIEIGLPNSDRGSKSQRSG
jgi:Domain of unknown function (DUF2019)